MSESLEYHIALGALVAVAAHLLGACRRRWLGTGLGKIQQR